MKLSKISLNYSREAGMICIDGQGCESVGDKLAEIDGIDGIEFDKDLMFYTLTFNKNFFNLEDVKKLYKEAKKA